LELKRYDSGGGAVLFATAVGYLTNNIDYEFAISRSTAGVFTVYVKGGVFTNWTQVVVATGSNPVTDNIHTSSKFLCSLIQTDVGTCHGDLVVHQGVLGLSELSAIY
jgi:hypothetical protein